MLSLLLLLLKTLGMLDAPTFQNGADLKPNKPTTPNLNFFCLE